MRILLTGATGYIGQRLLPVLLNAGHEVLCLVRDARRLRLPEAGRGSISVIEADLLERESLSALPDTIDAAYYLVHSMGDSAAFSAKEERCARNFSHALGSRGARQVVYLSGICNEEGLSSHLESRLRVEEVLAEGSAPLTVLRAAIIVGSGSASFEIMRDIVEKLPVMVTPRWVETRCQPIAIRSVLDYLEQVLLNEAAFGRVFDIGGPEVLSYRQMLLEFARVRGMRRWILPVPVLTPRLSSYWLYFVTATSFSLAHSLVDSMKNEVVCRKLGIDAITEVEPVPYRKAVQLAFDRIEQNAVPSSWKDAVVSSNPGSGSLGSVEVPSFGCVRDERRIRIPAGGCERVLDNIWRIGGRRGWYYGNFLWALRGQLDKFVGGVGLRRGRRSDKDLYAGEVLDFWRVLVADRQAKRLVLFAEMRLPGEAWLEFRIEGEGPDACLVQTATFRPRGVLGRLYWYGIYPLHVFVFRGMARRLVQYQPPTAAAGSSPILDTTEACKAAPPLEV